MVTLFIVLLLVVKFVDLVVPALLNSSLDSHIKQRSVQFLKRTKNIDHIHDKASGGL